MKFLILINLLNGSFAFSQQNLVPNGSFETVRTSVFDFFNNAQPLTGTSPTNYTSVPMCLMSHLAVRNHIDESIVTCWRGHNGANGASGNKPGLQYLIAPNLFKTVNGSSLNTTFWDDIKIYEQDLISYYDDGNVLSEARMMSENSSSDPSNASNPGLRLQNIRK